jgi:putative endonuclease
MVELVGYSYFSGAPHGYVILRSGPRIPGMRITKLGRDEGSRSQPGLKLFCSMDRLFFVYILASKSRTLYIGVTNDLMRRVLEGKRKMIPGFTSRYNINRLVHFEETMDIESAIAREKQLKSWLRKKKIDLIESTNPDWKDLSEDWLPKAA